MGRIVELVVLGLMIAMPGLAGATPPIIDGPAVLERSPAAIQASLGRPVRTKSVPPGDFRLSQGGMLRLYTVRGIQIDVEFEGEQSTTMVVAFSDAPVAPKTYEAALEAVNLRPGPRPDVVSRDSREWHGLAGHYFVRVIAAYPAIDHIDAIIVSIHPLP
jgi:hypothetical protein